MKKLISYLIAFNADLTESQISIKDLKKIQKSLSKIITILLSYPNNVCDALDNVFYK